MGVTVDATRHHPDEFMVLVDDLAQARKGSSWDHLERVLARAETVHSFTGRGLSGLFPGEGLISAARRGSQRPMTLAERRHQPSATQRSNGAGATGVGAVYPENVGFLVVPTLSRPTTIPMAIPGSLRIRRLGQRRGTMGPMDAVELVFIVVWALFWLYWLATAFSMKKGQVPWSRELLIRIVMVAIVFLLVRFGALRGHGLNREVWRDALGSILLFLGLGFAVWARLNIGQNWGSPMSRKVDPDLVTSGPYHLVRHPIYSGIVVALIGTAAALSWLWLFAAGLAGLYFAYSATVEERYMTTRFPDAYPAYKHSTKWFVPFVL